MSRLAFAMITALTGVPLAAQTAPRQIRCSRASQSTIERLRRRVSSGRSPLRQD